MKVRNSKSISIDEALLAAARGAILHPHLHLEILKELEELERKGKISRLPSTILEHYHLTMSERVANFEESCRQRLIVLSSY